MDARFMSRDELCGVIQSMVEREVRRQLNDMKLGKRGDAKYVLVTELCKELGVSRQTLSNWRKSRIKFMIDPYVQKVGGKVLYDVEGIKVVLREHGDFFGRGRNYKYKEALWATEADKRDTRFKDICWRLTYGETISEEDRIFYEEECKWRGDNPRQQ